MFSPKVKMVPSATFVVYVMFEVCAVCVIAGPANAGNREGWISGSEIQSFTETQKDLLTRYHNEARRLEAASDMIKLTWDDDIAANAQKAANICHFTENPYDDDFDPGQIWNNKILAQNRIVMGNIAGFGPKTVVDNWYNQRTNYSYSSGQCQGQCRRYLNLVASSQELMGCGIRYCPSLYFWGMTPGAGYLFICQYGPFKGYLDAPFQTGEACSGCPPSHVYCQDGLCSTDS